MGVDVGRRAAGRDTVRAIVQGLDLANEAFPFMAVGEAGVADCPVRVFRISFSGELAYEIATPWGYGVRVWEAVIRRARRSESSLMEWRRWAAADREGPSWPDPN